MRTSMIFSPNSMCSCPIVHKGIVPDIHFLHLLPPCLIIIVFLLLMTGCAPSTARQPSEQTNSVIEQASHASTPPTIAKPQPPPLPNYKNFADHLGNKGDRKGVVFYLNPDENYVLFAIKSSDTFFIADKSGTCLFQIGSPRENQTASQPIMPDFSITPGPCGLKYPDTSDDVIKIVSIMAEELVIPGVQDRLSGKPWNGQCSEKNFLEQTLLQKMPYDINASRSDLEDTISSIGIKIKNPLEIAFGDVVFFPQQKNTTAVGIYMGYGLVVYHKDCSKAGVHRLTGGIQYRIYRPITGFAWTRYQLRDTDFLLNHLDTIK